MGSRVMSNSKINKWNVCNSYYSGNKVKDHLTLRTMMKRKGTDKQERE